MASSPKVVTRFAPSPTGYLHIGGARTALFNWAFARRHGGTFILRIEDTDKARSTRQSLQCILADLCWLGIDWDEGPALPNDPQAILSEKYDPYVDAKGDRGPYCQSQRDHLYQEYLDKLRDLGRVYDDEAGGGAVRFRMPESDITVNDMVLGDVTIKRENLEDFIIMKGEKHGGGPTFHFANVVDDATMGVTHVLRAQEHLMNTPKHVAMFDALGIPRPQYAHMPLIFNPDGSKMSKRDKAKVARQAALNWIKQPGNTEAALLEKCRERHNRVAPVVPSTPQFNDSDYKQFLEKKSDAVDVAQLIAEVLNIPLPEIDVADFRQSGYLPEVILNYIALLGWSPQGKDEVGGERFDLKHLAANFNIEGIGKSNARFDRQKLLAFNGQTLQGMGVDAFEEKLHDFLTGNPYRRFESIYKDRAKMTIFAAAYQQRTRVLSDPPTMAEFLVTSPKEYDSKAVEKVLRKNNGAGLKVLTDLLDKLGDHEDWTPAALHEFIERYGTTNALGMGDIAQPLRVAITGITVSPPIHDTLALLGKERTLDRINRCVNLISSEST